MCNITFSPLPFPISVTKGAISNKIVLQPAVFIFCILFQSYVHVSAHKVTNFTSFIIPAINSFGAFFSDQLLQFSNVQQSKSARVLHRHHFMNISLRRRSNYKRTAQTRQWAGQVAGGMTQVADGRPKLPGETLKVPMEGLRLPMGDSDCRWNGSGCRWKHSNCQWRGESAPGRVKPAGEPVKSGVSVPINWLLFSSKEKSNWGLGQSPNSSNRKITGWKPTSQGHESNDINQTIVTRGACLQ